MPSFLNQHLLFTYVSPFCLFKTATSPWPCHSPHISWVLGAGAATAACPALPFYPCCSLKPNENCSCLRVWRGKTHRIAQTGNQCSGGGLTVPWHPHFHFSFSDTFLAQMLATTALTFSCPCWASQDARSRSQFPADTPDLALIPIVCCASGGLD